MKKIVIDTLGSDKGEEELVLGAIQAKKKHPDITFVFSGDKDDIERILSREKEDISSYSIIPSVAFDFSIDDVMSMIRFKGHCSILDAYDYAKEDKDVIGIISCGSTGMLLVSSLRHLGVFTGISFPVLGTVLYNINHKYFSLVDCGANIEVREQKLVQFASMGSALMRSLCGIESPRVGLLNVGKEENKGDSIRKSAFHLLKSSDLNFIGNIEGSDVFLDKADVVTCDGFSGNVVLKTAEAVGMFAMHIAEKNHEEKTAKQLYDLFAYNELGGAILLGTKKLVFKGHGASNRKTIVSIVDIIDKLNQNNFLDNLRREVTVEKSI